MNNNSNLNCPKCDKPLTPFEIDSLHSKSVQIRHKANLVKKFGEEEGNKKYSEEKSKIGKLGGKKSKPKK